MQCNYQDILKGKIPLEGIRLLSVVADIDHFHLSLPLLRFSP